MNSSLKLQPPRFTAADVTVTARRREFQGRFAVDVYDLRHRRYAGGETPLLHREVFERDQDAVGVLPYDPVRDRVVLIEQFRPGALRDPLTPWLIETVAGLIDEGESPDAACLRELHEEAGLTLAPSDLEFITTAYTSPGATSERVSLYLATADTSAVPELGGLASEHEDIRILTMAADEALELLHCGRVSNAACIILLQQLEIRRLLRP